MQTDHSPERRPGAPCTHVGHVRCMVTRAGCDPIAIPRRASGGGTMRRRRRRRRPARSTSPSARALRRVAATAAIGREWCRPILSTHARTGADSCMARRSPSRAHLPPRRRRWRNLATLPPVRTHGIPCGKQSTCGTRHVRAGMGTDYHDKGSETRSKGTDNHENGTEARSKGTEARNHRATDGATATGLLEVEGEAEEHVGGELSAATTNANKPQRAAAAERVAACAIQPYSHTAYNARSVQGTTRRMQPSE